MKTQQTVPTFESVWAALQETDRILSEKFAESDRLRQENERILKEQFAETKQIIQEVAQLQKENERKMQKMQQDIGSWSNNHGSFAEEYFFNSFEKGQKNFFGEKFDEILKNAPSLEKGFFRFACRLATRR